jgi:hypothetical protein
MTTFTINEQNEIVAFATTEEAAASMPAPFESFTSEEELAQLAASWPTERPVAIWNNLAVPSCVSLPSAFAFARHGVPRQCSKVAHRIREATAAVRETANPPLPAVYVGSP